MHEAQREHYNFYRDLSIRDRARRLPKHLATLLLIIDMAQNGATPFLCGDQMGDFYYMSPLIHLIFGVSCPAVKKMNAYTYLGGGRGEPPRRQYCLLPLQGSETALNR